MRALRFEKTGSLDALTVQEIPNPTIKPGEVLVQVKAAALNPSDIKNVLGAMSITTLPRTPGRDFAGIVVAASPSLMGKAVFGTGGNLGFGRDGSHAQLVVVPQTAVLPLPKGFSFEQAAAVGVAYMTAWASLINTARLQKGETVLILGANGSVGSSACRIAHKRGAKVLGTVRRASEIPKENPLPVDVWIDLETTGLVRGVSEATAGKGADVVFDTVGGAMFEKCLATLARRGRQIAINSSPETRVSFNLVDFYHNESRLFGVDSLKLSFEESAQILSELTPGFESGEFPPPKMRTFSLQDGPMAYREMNEGKIHDKVILIP